MTIITIQEAEAQLSQLLERVLRGEEILIAKAGKPVARLLPVDEGHPRVPGIAQGRVTEAFFEPLPEDELKAWEQ